MQKFSSCWSPLLGLYMAGGFLAGVTFGFTFLSALVGRGQHDIGDLLPACILFVFTEGLLFMLCNSAQLARDAVREETEKGTSQK